MSDRWGNPYTSQSAKMNTGGAAGMLGKTFTNMFSNKSSGVGGMFGSFAGSTGGVRGWAGMTGFANSAASNPYSGSSASINSSWGNMNQSGRYTPAPTAGSVGNAAGGAAAGAISSPNTADWAGVNQWDSFVAQASAKYGVPANLMKAVMRLESGGDPNSRSVAGATGLMQIMPDIWNNGNWQQLLDPAYNIDMGGMILKSNYDQYGSWEMAAKAYLGLAGEDAYGTDNNEYWQRVNTYWQELNATGGQGNTGGAQGFGAVASGAVSSIWGGQGERDLSYGFNAPNSLGLYQYGALYGMDGNGHTGVDIPMNIDDPVISPVSGTIVCGGTDNGPGAGAGSGGCSAFRDTMGQGAGRVEVLLDNGETVIFGHMSTSAFRPGDRINAGQVVGQAGGMNGGHVHLEWRVRDGSTGSGWRIVDPMTKLGQAGTGTTAGQQAQQSAYSTFTRQSRRVGGYIF